MGGANQRRMAANEAFSRVKIDNQLRDVDWPLTDGRSVRFEYPLADGTRADYVLCDRRGQALAVLEAKRASQVLSGGMALTTRKRSRKNPTLPLLGALSPPQRSSRRYRAGAASGVRRSTPAFPSAPWP
jgi:hypothetical protein